MTASLAPLDRAGLPGLNVSVLVGSLAINVLSLATPITILQVYDRVIPNEATTTLWALVLGLGVVVLLDGLLRLARAWIQSDSACRFVYHTQVAGLERLLAADPETYGRVGASRHVKRLEAIEQLRDHIAGQGRLIAADLPFVLFFLSMIYAIGGRVVLGPLAVIAVMILAALLLAARLKKDLNKLAVLDDRRYSFLLEVLSRIRTVKALAMEPLMERRYERLLAANSTGTHATVFNAGIAQGFSTIFASMALASVPVLGAPDVLNGRLSLGALAACTLLAGRTAQPLLRALTFWTQMQSLALARRRFADLAETPLENSGTLMPPPRLIGDIAFENLAWRPEDHTPLLLNGLNLRIPAGHLVALNGDTGAGKSVLLAMALGLVRPTEGTVSIDGRPLNRYDLPALRRQIGYVTQQPALFDGTVMDNLTLFQPEMQDAAMQAAKLTGLDEQLQRLANGYETLVGDATGTRLSGTLRQQVAITRALVPNPAILILDEPNAFLDAQADKNLRLLLRALKGRVTILLVTHRPSLMNLADDVYRIVDGRLKLATEACGTEPAKTVSSDGVRHLDKHTPHRIRGGAA